MRLPRFPEALPAAAFPATAGFEPLTIDFIPVPRLRKRSSGWTEERQRAFIAALALCGSVSAAAKSVGLTARGAYRLFDAKGADDFARAWDRAADIGLERLRCDALQRAIHGSFVPVYRRGRLVRVEHRRNDRLAIAMLSGRPADVDDYRRTAVSRREHRRDLKELDAARADRDRKIAEAERDYQAEADRLVERIHLGPRIRAL
jgi:hypothetical protein